MQGVLFKFVLYFIGFYLLLLFYLRTFCLKSSSYLGFTLHEMWIFFKEFSFYCGLSFYSEIMHFCIFISNMSMLWYFFFFFMISALEGSESHRASGLSFQLSLCFRIFLYAQICFSLLIHWNRGLCESPIFKNRQDLGIAQWWDKVRYKRPSLGLD